MYGFGRVHSHKSFVSRVITGYRKRPWCRPLSGVRLWLRRGLRRWRGLPRPTRATMAEATLNGTVALMDSLGPASGVTGLNAGGTSVESFAGGVLNEMTAVSDGVSVILVSSVSARQTSIFDSSALLILSYGTIFATGLVGNLLVILTLTRNQRGKVSRSIEYLMNCWNQF